MRDVFVRLLYRRSYQCTRYYTSHLLGVELSVRGLAFQQQDMGVSACATTAIWSALHKARDYEDTPALTPAQITLFASKYLLPSGRAIPSEGLTLAQMCQAIHATGLSPVVIPAEEIHTTRAYLYSTIKSGFCPIILLRNQDDRGHAVAGVGMKLSHPHVPTIVRQHIDEIAGDLQALYIHDDRRGPYLRANLSGNSSGVTLTIPKSRDGRFREDPWEIKYVLIPIHNKVRLSFSFLRKMSLDLGTLARGFIQERAVGVESWIARPHRYMESLFSIPELGTEAIQALFRSVPMARYVGIVRLRLWEDELLDLVIDTTGTVRNVVFSASFYQPRLRKERDS